LVGSADFDQANLDAAAGKIVPGDYIPIAVNLSSVPVILSIEAKVTGDAVVLTTGGETAVNDGTDNNMLLNIIASTAMVNEAVTSTTFAGTVATSISKAGQVLKFRLPAAAYEFGGTSPNFTFTRVSTDNGHGTALQLGGFVNKNADWSTFTGASAKTVGLSAVFAFSVPTEAELEATPVTGAFGFLGVTDAGSGFRNTQATSDINGGTIYSTVGAAYTIPFNFDGRTPANVRVNGTTWAAPAGFFNISFNTIYNTGGHSSTGIRVFTFTLVGESPARTYTFTVNVTS
jgi:hypothetical protein